MNSMEQQFFTRQLFECGWPSLGIEIARVDAGKALI